MDRTAEAFVAFAHELKFSDLSSAAIHAVKRSVIDLIGCALRRFSCRAIQAMRHLASQVTATKPATIIGTTHQELRRTMPRSPMAR